jgi:hypothetical protein
MSTLAKRVKKLGFPAKHRENKSRMLNQILMTVQKMGCCTIQEISEEKGMKPSFVQKSLGIMQREHLIEKVEIKRGGKGKGAKKFNEVFGKNSGKVLFYRERKELLYRILMHLSTSQGSDIKKTLTYYSRRFGLKQEEIDWLSKERISRQKVSFQIKPEEFEKLISSFGSNENLHSLFSSFSFSIFPNS